MSTRSRGLINLWRVVRRHLWVPAAGLSVALLFAAGVVWQQAPGSTTASAPEQSAVPVATTMPPLAPSPAEGPTAGTPRSVVIDSLEIDAPVVPIVSEGQSLDPPPDPRQLGWWSQGAKPGAAKGSALVTGHTVHDGGGALDDLETVEPGAEIMVRTSRGTIRYVAESVVILDKEAIARRSPELFSQEVPGRLVLVTCEDWDGSGYRSNVVVTAVPAT